MDDPPSHPQRTQSEVDETAPPVNQSPTLLPIPTELTLSQSQPQQAEPVDKTYVDGWANITPSPAAVALGFDVELSRSAMWKIAVAIVELVRAKDKEIAWSLERVSKVEFGEERFQRFLDRAVEVVKGKEAGERSGEAMVGEGKEVAGEGEGEEREKIEEGVEVVEEEERSDAELD